MYTPKIEEDLIRKIYAIGKAQGKPMTKVVDELLRPQIAKINKKLKLPRTINGNGN
jgi:hypothetical protein